MTTFFTPVVYPSIADLKSASYFDAVSDSNIDGIDVFGYVDGVPYAALYDDESYTNDDDESSTTWVTAGKPLNQYSIEGCCKHCGGTLSEYDGNCRWSDCVTNA